RTTFLVFFFFQAEDGIRDRNVTGVQTCALPIPPNSKAYKQMVSAKVRSYMKINGIQTITEPIAVHLNFYFTPPKSYSKKRIRAIEAKEELFTKKPDIDNLVKSVTDGMNGIMYEDDSQIVGLTAGKHYSHEDYVDVKVEIIDNGAEYYE